MNVFLIICLTIIVTAIASIDFHTDRNKANIKQLGLTGRKAKAVVKFIDIYPGFHLFANLVALLATILIACLAALTWGMLAGCFIALVVISLAQLLGARLVNLTDQLIINNAALFNKYFIWTGQLNSLISQKPPEPIADIDELMQLLTDSRIDCPTRLLIEKVLYLQHLPIEQLATKWSKVAKVSYKDKLTPKRIDELFQSQQKIFPVIRNDKNDLVGLLHFADISTVGQTEKELLGSMHRNFASCPFDTTVVNALRLMAENETTVIVVMKKDKICGLANLADILTVDPANPSN